MIAGISTQHGCDMPASEAPEIDRLIDELIERVGSAEEVVRLIQARTAKKQRDGREASNIKRSTTGCSNWNTRYDANGRIVGQNVFCPAVNATPRITRCW
jgi:hypothetical protein